MTRRFFFSVLLLLATLAGSACRTVPARDGPELTGEAVSPAEPALRARPTRPAVPAVREQRYREVSVSAPYIAITFDDGPNPQHTRDLLDLLRERGIPATFFVIGQRAIAHPHLLQRMVAEGHEIGNHTWSHPRLPQLTPQAIRWQINRTDVAIQAATGQTPVFFRPPYGATNPDIERLVTEEMGKTVILWSVDSHDWKHRDSQRVQREILTSTRPGAIILAHDIHRTTIAAMPAALDELQARGYRFVTVSDLIALGSSSE